ncbi:hypothetical protein HYV73_01620 [Candidatus Uhrbacteria bacterium]|nr:hypothetical protein [Candidatus Uhrbacteria bacterium]
MTLTTHAVMGAVIGQAVGHPVLGFTLAFATHLLIDMIPHGDSKMAENFHVHKVKQKQAIAYVMVDAITAIFIVLILANTKDVESLRAYTWGIAGGILPDLMVGAADIFKTPFLDKFHKFHFFFHNFFTKRFGDVPLAHALLAQIVFIVILQRVL